MADLDTGPSVVPSGERAQLILVAAIVLAISFVGIAVIVNSAIFTENMATRGDVPGSGDALDNRYETVQSITTAIETINTEHTDDLDAIVTHIEYLATEGGIHQVGSGSLVEVTYDSRTSGKRILQDNSDRNFTSGEAESDWTVAEDVDEVRAVQINVTDTTELATTSNAFTIALNDTADREWNLSISSGATSDEVEIDVETPITAETCTRDIEDNSVEIDVTDGTVSGEPCHALTQLSDGTIMWMGIGLGDEFDIQFRNSGNIQGNYSMIVDGHAVENGDLDNPPIQSPNDRPYWTDAIYSVDASYSYHTSAVSYETSLSVAPGESPGLTYSKRVVGCPWVVEERDSDPEGDVYIDGVIVDCPDLEPYDVDELHISNGGELWGWATVNDEVTLDGMSWVSASIDTDANVRINGDSEVSGNIEAEREIEIDDSVVVGNVVTPGDVAVVRSTITGEVYLDGTFDCSDSEIAGQSCSDYTPKPYGDWSG